MFDVDVRLTPCCYRGSMARLMNVGFGGIGLAE